jgi:dihydroneopterin aldolase
VGADRLRLEGMRFFAHHGDVPAERELGSRIDVDVELSTDVQAAVRTDSLKDAVDYVQCYERIRHVVEQRQFHLLESLAEAIAASVLDDTRVSAVRVRVAKQPPVAATIDRFAVVLERSREGVG